MQILWLTMIVLLLQPSSREGWQEVYLELPAEAERIEFVFKDKFTNSWDNPPKPNSFGSAFFLCAFDPKHL